MHTEERCTNWTACRNAMKVPLRWFCENTYQKNHIENVQDDLDEIDAATSLVSP